MQKTRIILTSYKQPDYISNSLSAIFAQDGDHEEIQLIFVDDWSGCDITIGIFENLVNNYKKKSYLIGYDGYCMIIFGKKCWRCSS